MEVLQVTSEQVSKVRKQFSVTEEDIKVNVDILKEWLRQEKPSCELISKGNFQIWSMNKITNNVITIADDKFLERCLLRNKFRLDQSRKKLEAYFTLRCNNLAMFQGHEFLVPTEQICMTVPLPKMTPNLERVIVWKLKIPGEYNLPAVCKYNFWLFELLIRSDYAAGDRFIADFEGHTASTILKNNPIVVGKFIKLYQGAYSGRVTACDFINAPSYVSHLLTILKQLLPKKFYDRIHVHKNLESLHKQIPKECLPKNYGGDLEPVENMICKWDSVFLESQAMFADNFNQMLRLKDEVEQRKGDSVGITGTIRKIFGLE